MRETMTRQERFDIAFSYEGKPDRLPVAPGINGYAPARWAGRTLADAHDPDLSLDLMLKAFDDLGGWDALYWEIPELEEEEYLVLRNPMRYLIPGRDLPDDYVNQAVEEEVITVEDYDTILERGFDAFWNEDLLFRITGWDEKAVTDARQLLDGLHAKAETEWAKRDCPPILGWAEFHPFFQLSLGRSFVPFSRDVYTIPDKVEAVIESMTAEMIPRCLDMMRESGRKYFGIGEERSSAFHYPPEIFDRLWMPFTKRLVEALWDEGFYTLFHLDTDFTKNLESFKQLPRQSFCLHLDGTTDIVNARKVLGDHCSLMGDVPASLGSTGTPEEMETYVTHLFREVGADGGFILNFGCECPADAKLENVKTMLDTARNSPY